MCGQVGSRCTLAPHIVSLSGAQLNAGVQSVDIYSYGKALVENAIYEVHVNANDSSYPANVATEVTKQVFFMIL